MRHSGFASFLLWETTHFLLDEASSEGTHFKDLRALEKSLLKKLGFLFAHLRQEEGFSEAPLTQFCSQNVTRLIAEWLERLETEKKESEVPLFLDEGIFIVEGLFPWMLRLVRGLLGAAVEHTAGRCFEKPRASLFSQFYASGSKDHAKGPWEIACFESTPEPSLAPHRDSKLIQKYRLGADGAVSTTAWLNLKREGFRVRYRGCDLEEMAIQDFKAEFTLREPGESPFGQKAIDWFELNPKFFFKGVEIDSVKRPNFRERESLSFKESFTY